MRIINQQYELITNLEDYSQRLNKRLLKIDNYFEILKNLQQYVNCQLIYIAKDHRIVTIPAMREKERESMLASIQNSSSKQLVKQTVQVFEREFATIYLISSCREFTEFESSFWIVQQRLWPSIYCGNSTQRKNGRPGKPNGFLNGCKVSIVLKRLKTTYPFTKSISRFQELSS